DSIEIEESLYYFIASIQEYETFFPWTVQRILLSIHSPFVPIDPFKEGVNLETNHDYFVYIQMGEEHLLESPYSTNCMDYEEIWKTNNKTGPRSQEMCKEGCWWNYFKSYGFYHGKLTMLEQPREKCNIASFDDILLEDQWLPSKLLLALPKKEGHPYAKEGKNLPL
ncbi:uncharacterized protein NPIL_555081, partial [Nephila pilipes]